MTSGYYLAERKSEDAMKYLALQYDPYVEVLAPESLRDNVAADIEKMVKKIWERSWR